MGLYPSGSAAATRGALAEIADLGARTVSLVVHWHQRDVNAIGLAPGSLTPSDARVVRAILDARAAGLKTLLFPIVWVEKRGPGKWRGTLAPKDRDAWWQSYEQFIVHYARLAEVAEADWLSVGSELGSTETWQDRWFHLVGRVERSTAASLLYSANWDHFEQVSFWPRLDAVGINGYMPIASSKTASQAAMTEAWRKAKASLLEKTERFGLPLILTEVGYLSRDGAAVKPWDYTSKARLDLEEQRRAYAAFSRAWRGEARLAGVVFWDWMGDGGAKDRGYTPRGKPAEKVARRFFKRRGKLGR